MLSFPNAASRKKLLVALLTGIASGVAIGQVNYSFGVLVPRWSEEYESWSRTEINAAFSIAQTTSATIGPVTGNLMDRYGPRALMTICSFLIAAGFSIISLLPTASSGSANIFQIWGAYILIGIGYSGSSLLGPGKMVGSWFSAKKRGRVMGMVTAFHNLFGLIMVQASTQTSNKWGWRATTTMFGIMISAVGIIFCIIVRNKPPFEMDSDIALPVVAVPEANLDSKSSDTLPETDSTASNHTEPSNTANVEVCTEPNNQTLCEDSESTVSKQEEMKNLEFDEQQFAVRNLFKDRLFYASTLGMLCAFFTFSGVLSQIIPALVAEGFTNEEAADIVSLVAIGGITSKLVCGAASERLGATFMLIVTMLGQITALFLFFFISVKGSKLYVVSLLIYGFSYGGVGALLSLVSLEMFGLQNFGKVFGIQSIFFVVPSLTAPIIAGLSFDNTGSYKISFLIVASVLTIGVLLLSYSIRLHKQQIKNALDNP